jgi:hypothetical protein
VRGRKTSRSFKVGDKVEIIGYRRLAWGNRKPQKYGFIVNINGAYHLVRPRWWKTSECFELYRGEIRLAARTRLR